MSSRPRRSTAASKLALAATFGVMLAVGVAPAALATTGYFQLGYGAKSKGLAGAGTALSLDTLAAATNPAGIAFVPSGVDVGVALFMPDRTVRITGNATQPNNILAPGETESGRSLFFIPDAGVRFAGAEGWSFDLAVYGNGGMNTSYPAFTRPCPTPSGTVTGAGVFCGGAAGVDFAQAFLSPTAAYEIAPGWAIGAGPTLAAQRFSAKGIGAFAALSADPANLSDNGHDTAFGFGARIGVQGAVTEWLRLGASWQSRIDVSRFGDYAGLFAGRGEFDVPESWRAGVAVSPLDGVWLLGDYQHIAYDRVAPVGNTLFAMAPLGDIDGPGFGWSDVDVWRVAVEWQATPDVALRAGFATLNQPVPEDQLLFNILAPGVVEDHWTAGVTWQINGGWSVDLSAVFAPQIRVSGPNPVDPAQTIEVRMHQVELVAGIGYRF